MSTFGSLGSGNGQFFVESDGCSHPGITTDTSGNVYVADTYNQRIQKFAYPVTTTTFPSSPTTGTPTNITLTTPDGTDITCSNSVTESSLATPDTNQSYPLGLVNFCFTTTTGSTNQVGDRKIYCVNFCAKLLSERIH